MIEEIFKNSNIKLTKQRKLIYNIIKDDNHISTIKYIVSKSNDSLNTATIYRIIDTFLSNNLIVKKIGLTGEVYYEIKPQGHNHYINCIKCHKKKKIDPKEIEKFEQKVSNGYRLVSHDIEFSGICENCVTKTDKF